MEYSHDQIAVDALVLVTQRLKSILATRELELSSSPFLSAFSSRMNFHDAFAWSALDGNRGALEAIHSIYGVTNATTEKAMLAVTIFNVRRRLTELFVQRRPWESVIGDAVSQRQMWNNVMPDEPAKLALFQDWCNANRRYDHFPEIVRSALLMDTWRHYCTDLRLSWFGRQLAAGLLKTHFNSSLLALNVGLKSVSPQRYHGPDQTARLVALMHGIERSAIFEIKEHKALIAATKARQPLLLGRRTNSKLGSLQALATECPIISVATITERLNLTTVGARNLIQGAQLNEITGRKRDCLWSIL